jgi:hypothetical protein
VLGDYRFALRRGGEIADHVLELRTAAWFRSSKRQSRVVV